MTKDYNPRINVDTAEEARKLRREGASLDELAAKYGMTKHCLIDVLKDRTHRRLVTVELSTDQWARLTAIASTEGKTRNEIAYSMITGLLTE